MKKYFITGLGILLPLVLTLIVIEILFNLLTDPFLGIVRQILAYFGFTEQYVIIYYASRLFVLIFMFFFIVLIGYLARWIFVNYIFSWSEYILQRVPVVSVVYRTCKDVISTLITSRARSFKQVVFVPFPKENTFTLGLLTNESVAIVDKTSQEELVAVFIPTTPNPTSGFMLMYKQSDLTYVDIRVEDAIKYIVSCGVLATPFKKISKEEAMTKLQQEKNRELKQTQGE